MANDSKLNMDAVLARSFDAATDKLRVDAEVTATTNSATNRAPRRIPLGTSVFATNAVIGTVGQPVYMSFNSPIAIQQGQYFQILAKNLGTVTSAGVITHQICVDGYWE